MMQQIIALLIISYFIAKIYWQKRCSQMNSNEFMFWLAFWLLAAAAIIFVKRIDALLADFGFSASGIDILLYMGAAALFYLVLRIRIRLAKIEKNITKLARDIALKTNKDRL